MPTLVRDLDTPAVVIDLDIVEANIRRAQETLSGHGLANRPHIKTHKIPALAKLQMDAGAVGITCQKIGEVEVMADAGVADDILLTYNILGDAKTERLAALISEGHIKPGERLPSEQELMAQLQVGRSSIREAIRGLALIATPSFFPRPCRPITLDRPAL